MRWQSAAALLFFATLIPEEGIAQVYQFRTPPPEVTAAADDWQISGRPIIVQGLVYYPTDVTRPFDGNVMMQTGMFGNVPVFADATVEPFSAILVPVARGRMRVYERRREGDLAGTTGSQAPAFPVQPLSAIPPRQGAAAVAVVGTAGVERGPAPAGTTGTLEAPAGEPNVPRPPRTHVESIPRPRASDGVWIRYDGAKWYSDGEAVSYTPDRFTQVGVYSGFPVYRDRSGDTRIWVAVVQDGPVAPYSQR